ncbi:MAG: hypothetical protein LC808_29845 [Actinobacteria bacterium]|nr:hypothetical protein [Actinomycetota bacterium]
MHDTADKTWSGSATFAVIEDVQDDGAAADRRSSADGDKANASAGDVLLALTGANAIAC